MDMYGAPVVFDLVRHSLNLAFGSSPVLFYDDMKFRFKLLIECVLRYIYLFLF